MQHVDDALLGSCIFGTCCIENGFRKLWPSDVGVSVEESGNSIRFLQAQIDIPHDDLKTYIITPFNPNVEFALGISEFQNTARLGLFIDIHINLFEDLRQFVIGRILTYNVLISGASHVGMIPIIHLVLEIRKLLWPKLMISRAFRAVPSRHSSPFLKTVKLFSAVMAAIRFNVPDLTTAWEVTEESLDSISFWCV